MDYGKTIKIGSRWTYVGPDGTSGMNHTVIGTGKGVVTWSDPLRVEPTHPEDTDVAGFSWYGPAVEFLRQFKSCD